MSSVLWSAWHERMQVVVGDDFFTRKSSGDCCRLCEAKSVHFLFRSGFYYYYYIPNTSYIYKTKVGKIAFSFSGLDTYICLFFSFDNTLYFLTFIYLCIQFSFIDITFCHTTVLDTCLKTEKTSFSRGCECISVCVLCVTAFSIKND
jgi:hypothetical protein